MNISFNVIENASAAFWHDVEIGFPAPISFFLEPFCMFCILESLTFTQHALPYYSNKGTAKNSSGLGFIFDFVLIDIKGDC